MLHSFCLIHNLVFFHLTQSLIGKYLLIGLQREPGNHDDINSVGKRTSRQSASVDNGFEEFIVDVKETCAYKFKIGESTFGEGEDTCRERCRSDPDCNYYFYTFKETCDDKEWCVLYKDCSERRIPSCNGRTFRNTVKCIFEAIPSNECPDNANLAQCSHDMTDGELCEADRNGPIADYNIDNCGSVMENWDVFRCKKQQPANKFVRFFREDKLKCNPSDSLFELKNMDANEEKCKAECSKNEKCVRFSIIWDVWCIGCSAPLYFGEQRHWAIAFKKIDGIDIPPTVAKFEELIFNEDTKLMKQLELVVLNLYRQFEQLSKKVEKLFS